jgi:hypothetical protein
LQWSGFAKDKPDHGLPRYRPATVPCTARRPAGRVALATVKQELADAGYTVAEEHRFLPDQFFVTFTAKNAR